MTKSPAREHTKDVEYEVANREAKLNKNATRITDAFDIFGRVFKDLCFVKNPV